MNILIADDEPLARERLRSLVQELGPGYRVVGEVADGQAAVSYCQEHPVDLALLDVSMPLVDGLSAAGQLARLPSPPAVVFVTAHGEYALDAFERQAVDYLVKPVRRQRLQAALERARVITRPQLAVLKAMETKIGDSGARICATYRGRLECVPVEQVLYCRADQKYVVVKHLTGQLLVEDTLKVLEDKFPDQFLRVHRNALVSKHRVVRLERDVLGRWMVCLQGSDELLDISRRHLGSVRAWLLGAKAQVPADD